MKTMTCKDMGGPCDFKMTADTPEEIIKKGEEHVKAATDKSHIKITKQMGAMTPKENKEWNEMFMKKWNAAPDSK
jgi:predicted small metal-binding protein